MSYVRTKSVNFGKANAGLATVGYTLTGGARTTTGVVETVAGSGCYAAPVTFAAGFAGTITWDTGGSSPIYAVEDVNPGADEYTDAAASAPRTVGAVAPGAITSAAFGLGTVNAAATGLLERLTLLVYRFFPPAGGSVTAPKSGNGSLVVRGAGGAALAAQAAADDGTTQTLGPAS